MPICGAREEGLREAAGEFVFGIEAAFRGAQYVHWNRGQPLITEEPLMRGRIVGLDEGLMTLVSRHRRPGERELVVVQPPLDVEVGFDQIVRALPCGTLDGLVRELQADTGLLEHVGGIGPAAV
jgi:hypothetical protein